MNELELGLLGDPEQLRKLLAQAQLQPEDRSQANAQALLAFGAALMGAKKGRELEAFGSGLMGGLAARNNALQDAQTTRGRNLAQMAGAQEMMSRGLTMKQQAEQLKRAQRLQEVRSGFAGGPMAGATPPGGGDVPADGQSAPAGREDGTVTRRYVERQMAIADHYEASGFPEEADKAREQAMKYLPKVHTVRKGVGPDGRPAVIPVYTDGTMGSAMPYTAGLDEAIWKDDGANIYALNPADGKPMLTIPKQMTPGEVLQEKNRARKEAVGPAQSAAGAPAEMSERAKAIAEYRLAPLTGYALRSPQAQALMEEVLRINPNYNGTEFAARQKAVNAFRSGVEGRTTRSLNVAVDHLDTLQKYALALHNKDIQALNVVKNAVETQLGYAAPVGFDAMKQIVMTEVVKAVTGAQMAYADREEAMRSVKMASSPKQLADVMHGVQELLAGQLDGLRRQYEAGTGRDDFDTFLSDGVKKRLRRGAPNDKASVRSEADRIISGGQ